MITPHEDIGTDMARVGFVAFLSSREARISTERNSDGLKRVRVAVTANSTANVSALKISTLLYPAPSRN
jgi:hypothetical protein